MNKWLSLIVMSTLLLGAAYLAVATETGRTMLKSNSATRAVLAEVDAFLAQNPNDAQLLEKRARIVEKLTQDGELTSLQSESDRKAEALAEEQARLEASGEYYSMLLDRLNNGSTLTPVEKVELLHSGMLKGEEDPAYQAVVADLEGFSAEYLDALESRLEAGIVLSDQDKELLHDAGRFEDTRGGDRDPLDAYGGPDGFGYRYIDNMNGDTATFAWQDIVGAPGTVPLTAINNSDDVATAVALSFTFPFYGVGRTTIYPSTNGAIGMTSVSSLSNTCTLPTTTFPSGGIWPLWDDLHTGRGGTGVSGTVSDSGNIYVNDNGSRIIIQWDSVGRFSPSYQHTYSFQAILYADGKIKLQWHSLNRYAPSTTYPTATVGIQQGSTAPNNNYLLYSCNLTSSDSVQHALAGRAVWFYPGALNADDFVCQDVVAPATPYRVPTGSAFNIIGRFRNAGTVTQAGDVGYIFNNGAPVVGTTASLAPNATGDVDFAGTETAPGTAGTYVLKIFSNLATDVDRRNDTCFVNVQVFNCADEVKTNAFADTFTTCGAINDFANTCLGTADGSEDYIFQWTITQPGAWNILAIGTTTTTRGLLVSTACPPDSFNCLAAVNQSQDTLLINCLQLGAGTYYIMVDRSSGCDQVRLYTSPCQDHDYTAESVLQPSPLRVAPSAVFNVVGRFRNIGTFTEAADVAYRFNGGPVVTGVTASVAPGITSDVDFTGTETAPAVVGDYELLMYSNLTTDQNRLNDTLRVTVLVRECSDESQSDAFVDAGTTCGASNEWSNTCLGSADASEDYIYRWTTTANGAWNLRLTASTTATRGLVVSTSCPPDSFNCVAFLNSFQDTLDINCLPLAAGTYYIMVDRSTGCDDYTLAVTACTEIGRCCYNGGANCVDNGAYDCQLLAGSWERGVTCASSPCPQFIDGGETCAQAVLLPVPSTVRSSTTGGVDDDPGFTCESNFNGDDYVGSNTAEDKWYKIIGTGNTITVSLCAAYTNYDTQILVTCSPDCQNFTCVGGNDDAFTTGCSFSGLRSIETFCSEVGREYYVVVDGWGTADGNFELIITDNATPCQGAVDCAPEGRCCYLDNGAPMCVDNLAAECSSLGGTWNDALNCASTPCEVGRCCYLSGGLPDCEDNTLLECNALGGQWNDALSCTSDPCPTGRCCYNNGDNCVTTTELHCTALAGLWDAGLTCEANPCPAVLQGSDACVDAVLVPAFNQQYLGTNVGATPEVGLPACASWYNPAAQGVWYKVMGTGNTITVSVCTPLTTYDSEIGAFCGETCETLICVTSSDDNCASPFLASEMSFCTVLGAEYKILIAAWSTGTGTFAMTVTDDGVPCVPVVECPVTQVPCDPVIDLRAYVATVGNLANRVQLHFVAPQVADYKVWYSTNPANDGDPDDGLDPMFTLEATIPNVPVGPVVWDGSVGFDPYRIYVVTADCTP